MFIVLGLIALGIAWFVLYTQEASVLARTAAGQGRRTAVRAAFKAKRTRAIKWIAIVFGILQVLQIAGCFFFQHAS